MRAEAEVQSNDIQAIKEKLRFPYCEIDDPKFMEVMSLQQSVQYYHDKKLGKKRSSEDSDTQKQERYFQELIEAVDLLYEKMQKHPDGLFLRSISNVVLFYNLSVFPYIGLEDKKAKLYPKMNFILTHALTMGFSVNEIVARHFVLKEDQDKRDSYLEHLRINSPQVKVEEGNYIEYKNLFKFDKSKKFIGACLSDFLSIIEKIIFFDSKDLQIKALQEHRALWEVGGKQIISIRGSEIIGKTYDLIDYQTNLNNQGPLKLYLGVQNQASFEKWRLEFARYKDELPHSISGIIDYLSLMTREVYKVEVDYTQIVRDKFTNMVNLLQAIVATHSSKESDNTINNNNFCDAFFGLIRRYFVGFRGEQKALEKLLNDLYTTLENEEIKKNVTENIFSTFSDLHKFSKSREFVNYRENFKILTKVIIQHVPLFLLSSVHFNKGNSQLGEVEEFVIPQLLYDVEDKEGRALLYQAILSQDPKSYELHCDQISYCVVSPDSPLYQKIVEENPDMQEVLHNILFAKLRSLLKKGNSSLNAKGIKHLYETLDNLGNDELRGFLESLKQLELKESKILKDFLLGAEENGKIRHNNFSGRLFSQFFAKGLYEVIDLVNSSLPLDKHRDYFLKQSFVFLLEKQRYSQMLLFNDIKLSDDTSVFNNKDLVSRLEAHITSLDECSLVRILEECHAIPKIKEMIDERKAVDNEAKSEGASQVELEKEIKKLLIELESLRKSNQTVQTQLEEKSLQLEHAQKSEQEIKERNKEQAEQLEKLKNINANTAFKSDDLQQKRLAEAELEVAKLKQKLDHSRSENSDLKHKLAAKRSKKEKSDQEQITKLKQRNAQLERELLATKSSDKAEQDANKLAIAEGRLQESLKEIAVLQQKNHELIAEQSKRKVDDDRIKALEQKLRITLQENKKSDAENQRLQGVVEELQKKISEDGSKRAEELAALPVQTSHNSNQRSQNNCIAENFQRFWNKAVEHNRRFSIQRSKDGTAKIFADNSTTLEMFFYIFKSSSAVNYVSHGGQISLDIPDVKKFQDVIKNRYLFELIHGGADKAMSKFYEDIDARVMAGRFGWSAGYNYGYNAGCVDMQNSYGY